MSVSFFFFFLKAAYCMVWGSQCQKETDRLDFLITLREPYAWLWALVPSVLLPHKK